MEAISHFSHTNLTALSLPENLADKIISLRKLVETVEGTEIYPRLYSSSYVDGFPAGKLIDVSGSARYEFLCQVLMENAQHRIAWIESDMVTNPYALWQRGVNLQKLTFIETKDLSWTVTQVLQSQVFPLVVICDGQFDEKSMRRFQLFAEKYPGHIFFLNDEEKQNGIAALHLQVARKDAPIECDDDHGLSIFVPDWRDQIGFRKFDVSVLRRRGFA